MDTTLDERHLPDLLDRFYARVRTDALLGPLFNEAIHDWPHHLERLRDFWSSVMLTSGRYKGNPMAMHLKHAARIEPTMFDRWLALWREVTGTMLPAEVATVMQAKAARIAESLQIALKLHGPGGRASKLARPSKPYRSTLVFDQDSLPAALRQAHCTKTGVWGVIRVLTGQLRYTIEATGQNVLLDPSRPGLVRPKELHHVTPIGAMTMRVDFYDHEPAIADARDDLSQGWRPTGEFSERQLATT